MTTARRVDAPDGTRFYDTPCGLLPSVTSILKVVDRPGLTQWLVRRERERAIDAAVKLLGDGLSPAAFKLQMETILAQRPAPDGAAERGGHVHAWLEKALREEVTGKPQAIELNAFADTSVNGTMEAFTAWRKTLKLVPLTVERFVYSEEYEYAGTLDALAETDDGPTIIDWKSGKSIHPEAYLQAAAYANAVVEMKIAKPPIHGMVVRLPRTSRGTVEVHRLSPDDLKELFTIFTDTLKVWRGQPVLDRMLRRNRG